MSERLSVAKLRLWRDKTLAEQGGGCALCGLPPTPTDPPVADHDHATGQLRGVLHRSCNALLGNIENNYKRYGLRNVGQLAAMLKNAVPYMHLRRGDETPLYPSHRSADEKRELRNKRARQARAARKAAT